MHTQNRLPDVIVLPLHLGAHAGWFYLGLSPVQLRVSLFSGLADLYYIGGFSAYIGYFP